MCEYCQQGYHIIQLPSSDCVCCSACNTPPCTLCGQSIDEYPLWGIDFPNCGPVHGDCADYDYWLSSRENQPLQRLIQQRHIREQGWLPTPCAVPIY